MIHRHTGAIPRIAEVNAMDAETGEHQWTFKLPDFNWPAARGDDEALGWRLTFGAGLGGRRSCWPDVLSNPLIDANGSVLIGSQDGNLYVVKDVNGDGAVDHKAPEMFAFDQGS